MGAEAARALGGGVLIGLAAAVLALGLGRIAGVSGILSGLGDRTAAGRWRWAFVLGLAAALPLLTLWGAAPAAPRAVATGGLAILAGALVGFGARLGSGCTSGHGVCGLARLSPRSLAATAVFMTTAAATVYVLRHGIGGAP